MGKRAAGFGSGFAVTEEHVEASMRDAYMWLRDNGWDCIRGCWMKGPRFARVEPLLSGRAAIKMGVPV